MPSPSATWDDIYTDHEWARYPSEDLIRFIAKRFPSSAPRGRVLEVGCGTGANLRYLAAEGFWAHGIDFSEVAVERARERMAEVAYLVDHGDISDLSRYGSGLFQAVLDVQALSCNPFETAQTIIAEMHRVLGLGGLVYSRQFTTSCAASLLKDRGYIRYATESDIHDLFRHFHILSLERLDRTVGGHTYGDLLSEWSITARKHD